MLRLNYSNQFQHKCDRIKRIFIVQMFQFASQWYMSLRYDSKITIGFFFIYIFAYTSIYTTSSLLGFSHQLKSAFLKRCGGVVRRRLLFLRVFVIVPLFFLLSLHAISRLLLEFFNTQPLFIADE